MAKVIVFLAMVCAATGMQPMSLSSKELTKLVGGSGRAKSIWQSLKTGVDPLLAPPSQNDDLPFTLTPKTRGALEQNGIDSLVPGFVESTSLARDGTRKLLVRFEDGLAVESVVIPHLRMDRTTLCVSTQVGCDRGCSFCATAQMGLVRNLTASEIAAQYFHATKFASMTNVVFMGMGDAGRNTEAARDAAEILTDPFKFGLAKTKVTISTVGPSPQAFLELAEANAMLAWSIHSADDDLRKQLVPTHSKNKYTMVDLRDGLIAALKTRPAVRARTLMCAATIIKGINDSDEDAARLARFVGPLVDACSKVNIDLIPVNPVEHAPHFESPSTERLDSFRDVVKSTEPRVHVAYRVQRGDDANAACGQLALHSSK